MAVEVSGKYLGDLTCEVTHGPSGNVIQTTAPVDHGGEGTSFAPTDLCASAFGT